MAKTRQLKEIPVKNEKQLISRVHPSTRALRERNYPLGAKAMLEH